MVKAYDRSQGQPYESSNNVERDTRFGNREYENEEDQQQEYEQNHQDYEIQEEEYQQNQIGNEDQNEFEEAEKADEDQPINYLQQPIDAMINGLNPNKAGDEIQQQNEKLEDYDIQIQSLSFQNDNDEKIQPPPTKKLQKMQTQNQNKKAPNNIQRTSKNTNKSLQQPMQNVPKKSYLQQVEEKTRFIAKTPPKKSNLQSPQTPKIGELKILQISKCNRTNNLLFLTQLGNVVSYKKQADMRRFYPNELIKFYESKIEFAKIPKLTK